VGGQLTSLERKTLGALITIDVHARDVTDELASTEVELESDFAWKAQLRYYWETEELEPSSRKKTPQHAVAVRLINATRPYGYEYLGLSSRLVSPIHRSHGCSLFRTGSNWGKTRCKRFLRRSAPFYR
jgi:dynein heavy chain